MIRLVTLLKRKPGTTHEQFLEHWHERHGPLIANSTAANYVRRYEQHPAAWPEPGSGQPEPEYDGVTVQWFDSLDDFYAHMREPDFPAMMDDVARFLDVSQLQVVLTEEPVVVLGDDGVTPTAS